MDTSYRSGLSRNMSINNNNIDNNTNRRTSTDTQRSFSLSFGNKLELPLRYIDIKQGHDSGSTLGTCSSRWPKPQRQRSGRRSNRGSIESLASSAGPSMTTQLSSAVPQHKQDWTASERAEHVATDPKLQSLFQAELSKVGVVTTAAYKAVHQQFIYSEPVNQDIEYITSLAEAHRRASEDTNASGRRGRPMLKRRSSRFGGLMKSMASVVQSNDVTSEILNDMESKQSLKMDKYKDRRGSNTSSRSLKLDKRGSMGSCRSIDIEGCGGLDESTFNLAPRRCSKVDNLTEEEKQLLKGSNNQKFDAFLHPIQDTLVQSTSSSESDNKSSSVREEFELRRSLEKSLLLQDIFDGDEGAALYAEITSPLDDDYDDDEEKDNEVSKPSTSDDDECATAPTCQLSRLETMSLRDIDFDPNDSPVSLKPSRRASVCSIDSRCNWLPWPEPQDDDANEDDLLVSFTRRDSIESIQNNSRARAA